jgi:hypothetical protein
MLPASSGLNCKSNKKADLSDCFMFAFLLALLWTNCMKMVQVKLQLWELKLKVTGILLTIKRTAQDP